MADSRLTLRCSACGSLKFIQPADPKPEDEITCAGCGRKATVEATRQQAIEAGKKLIADQLRQAFKKR